MITASYCQEVRYEADINTEKRNRLEDLSMRKALASAVTVIGMMGVLAATPSAAASVATSKSPSPVVVATSGFPATEVPQRKLSGIGGVGEPASVDSTWYTSFMNARTMTCFDDSANYSLRVRECDYGSWENGYQDWRVYFFDLSYKFTNRATGRCLDGSSGHGVRTHTCSEASYSNGYQKWEHFWGEDIWDSWRNVATGKCLDYSDAYGLRLHDCSVASFDNGYQAWAEYF
ncbi:RICIN domain-containing protein [Streptomyces filamentosus]